MRQLRLVLGWVLTICGALAVPVGLVDRRFPWFIGLLVVALGVSNLAEARRLENQQAQQPWRRLPEPIPHGRYVRILMADGGVAGLALLLWVLFAFGFPVFGAAVVVTVLGIAGSVVLLVNRPRPTD